MEMIQQILFRGYTLSGTFLSIPQGGTRLKRAPVRELQALLHNNRRKIKAPKKLLGIVHTSGDYSMYFVDISRSQMNICIYHVIKHSVIQSSVNLYKEIAFHQCQT